MKENYIDRKDNKNRIKLVKNIKELNQKQKHVLVMRESIKFFEEYGYDIEVLLYYGIALRKNGFYNEAINCFTKMISLQNEEENYLYYNSARIELFKAYYMIDNYEKAYELWDFTQTRLNHQTERHIYNLDFILKMKLGLEHDEVNEKNMHIINYKKSFGLEHIEKHIKDFSNNINISDVFDLAMKEISVSRKFPLFSTNDVYLYNFPNIGVHGEYILKVVTNKGTNEIITMYPTEIENEYKDKINYKSFLNNNLYEEYINKKESKVKKLSQIDKFKNRFKK